MLYLQVVLQNDKNILLILENLKKFKKILIIFYIINIYMSSTGIKTDNLII
jgi:hypothetical protein